MKNYKLTQLTLQKQLRNLGIMLYNVGSFGIKNIIFRKKKNVDRNYENITIGVLSYYQVPVFEEGIKSSAEL